MNFAKTSRTIAMLLGSALLVSCDKNAVQDITGPLPSAKIKFFNFGVNAPGVNYYANDTKVTAISSTTGAESTTGVAYGAVSSGGFYSALAPGQYAFKGKIAATVDKDLAVTTVNATLADGKAYSFYTSGFYNTTTKSVEGFVVEDNYPAAIDYTVATVRFVNAISNAQPLTLNAFLTGTTTPVAIGGAVPYKSAGAFVTIPPGVYDLSAFGTGIAVSRTAVSFSAGRTYTITARGDITILSTSTAVNRAFLDNTLNR